MKRKKNTRQRAGTTHGWGSMKKHRGAGHRGGRGNAGSGKRGDAKKPRYWADKSRYGKKGFTSHHGPRLVSMNVGHLAGTIVRLAREGLAVEKAGVFAVDLARMGIDRLLGSGSVEFKLHITVKAASPRAIEKVKAAGGEVTVAKVEAQAEKVPAKAEA